MYFAQMSRNLTTKYYFFIENSGSIPRNACVACET